MYILKRGFTLIELLAVMCCMAVVLAWGMSGFSDLISRYHTHLLKNQFMQVVQYSRVMALSKGRDLALNPLDDDWSKGMVLFVDNAHHHYTPEDEMVQLWKWSSHGVQIIWLGFQSKRFLVFFHELSHAASNGQFHFTKQEQLIGKLVLNRMGRVVVD